MICPRCLYRGSARVLRSQSIPTIPHPFPSSTTFRTLSTFPTSPANSTDSVSLSPPQSTSAAQQPLGTPSPSSVSKTAPTSKTPPRVVSSVAAGTILKGLNYFKNKPDPVALADNEYPAWLWDVLSEKKSLVEGQKEEVDPRLYSKSAKTRQVANKRARQEALLNPGLATPKVPIYEQSIDLPAEDAEASLGARQELTKAMRAKRRKGIKEANFLKSMS